MKHKANWPYRKGREFPLNIGVFSLHPHAGATFVSVLLAEYLSNVIGYKTAVIENSSKGDLLSLQSNSKAMPQEQTFQLHRITYCCHNSHQKEDTQLLQGFECYVKDLGSSYARARELILACDLTFLLFNWTPWYCNMETLTEKLMRDYGEKVRTCLVGNQIPQSYKKQLYKQLHCEFLDFESSMFSPSLKAVQLFHQVIWSR